MNFRRVWRMCPGRWFLPVIVPQWIWWFCEMNSWVSWIVQVLFRYMERWRKYHRYSVDIAVIRRVGRYALSQGAFPQVLPWKGWRKTVLLLYPWRFRRSGDNVHHWIENCFCAKQVAKKPKDLITWVQNYCKTSSTSRTKAQSLNASCIPGLDTNDCPLGNSKFILLSDNLNICLWLSACQVEKIIKLAWPVSHNVIGALDNVNISCGHILQTFAFAGLLSIYTLC